jgi:acetate kinase
VKLSHDAPVRDISRSNARVRALVARTDEGRMIAQQTARIAGGHSRPARPGPIPISVSARHVHLDPPTFAALFGEGARPTPYKVLSQPGQFACHERLNLIGPRGRIDGVRVLGPLRSKNQIEVSRTDEFTLGVDAPLRDSGQTKDSAPITLEGPKGTVALHEGLICAKRHIHMTPEDAARFGVTNRDEVEVAIIGGPRDLIFGEVLIRVSPSYALEMHIDTDEANAAELSNGVAGDLVYTGVMAASAELRTRRSTSPATFSQKPETRVPAQPGPDAA